MSRGLKILVVAFVVYAALAGAAVTWAAMTLYRDGLVSVRVGEHKPGGARFAMAVPGSLVRMGLGAVRIVGPADEEFRRAAHELRRLRLALAALAAEVEDCPDAVLVEVEDGPDHVRVEKRSGAFWVRVESDDADIDVRVPAALVSVAFEALGSSY